MEIEEWLDTKLGQDIWRNKYCFNNETFDEWLDRVSNGNKDLRQLIKDKKFLFGGRTLTNYNTNKKGASTSNCYSSGYAPDNLEGLMELNKNIALTYKAQGGQGISLSKIRPKGSKLSNGYETDGIIPFMEIFNATTSGVSQGGSRKGALMMSINAWHKEAETFIKIKSQTGKIEKANLSLEIDDDFMQCVEKDLKNNTETKIQKTFEYDTGSITYEVIPIKLYKEFCKIAYDWAEPGVIYTNRFRNYNLMQYISDYEIITGNPCGEQPLPKDGACNLGALNLSEFVDNPYTKDSNFDFNSFTKAIEIAIKGLDKVIDYGYKYHALQSQRDMAYNYRNIGLGIMGLGSMFFKLGIKYGDKTSLKLIDKIMKLMFRTAIFSSNKLAKEKGTFPKYDNKVFDSKIIHDHFSKEEIKNLKIHGLRNCSLLSVAPTGSIGTMLNMTTGIEPAFRISYKRKTVSLHKEKDVFYEVFVKEAEEYKKKYNTNDLPDYFISSENINYIDRINMQATVQNHVDTAISSTVNLPQEATIEDVENLYLYAWKKGIKGITIYRDGCARSGILFSEDEKDNKKSDTKKQEYEIVSSDDLPRGFIEDVPSGLNYRKYKLSTGCGKLYVFVGVDETEEKIYDIFCNTDGESGCVVNTQAVSRLISETIRGGMPLEYTIKQLNKAGTCPSFQYKRGKGDKLSNGKSCASAIGNILKDILKEFKDDDIEIKNQEKETKKDKNITINNPLNKLTEEERKYIKENGEIVFAKRFNKCPECGEELHNEGGCQSCTNCGFSRCD